MTKTPDFLPDAGADDEDDVFPFGIPDEDGWVYLKKDSDEKRKPGKQDTSGGGGKQKSRRLARGPKRPATRRRQ